MSKISLSPDLIKRIMKIDTVEDKINFINNYKKNDYLKSFYFL